MAEGIVTPDAFENMAASVHPLIQTVVAYWHDTAKPLIMEHVVAKCPPPLQDILSQDTTYLAIATVLLFLILIIVGRALAGGSSASSSSSGGPAVLLVGPCDAGKTALLHTLQGYPVQSTVASIKQTEATVLSGGQRVRVVDIPGHPRVRGAVLARYAPSVAKLVFVINSVDFMAQRSDTAELLVDVLTHPSVAKRRPPILMVCTRGDAGVRAHTCDFIRKMLEKEIEAIRSTRNALDDGDRRGAKGVLGVEGSVFSFGSLGDATGIRVVRWVQVHAQDPVQVSEALGTFLTRGL